MQQSLKARSQVASKLLAFCRVFRTKQVILLVEGTLLFYIPFRVLWCSYELWERGWQPVSCGRRGLFSCSLSFVVVALELSPKSPSTAHLRTLIPKTIPSMGFGTRVLKWEVDGFFGFWYSPSNRRQMVTNLSHLRSS